MATKQDLAKLFTDMSRLILDNNVVLLNAMDEKITKNNEVLIPMMGKMMDEKIAKNNIILVDLIDKKIRDNNDILIPLIDKKIKDNNEYIFSEFNDQTERILSLFEGVIRVRRDGAFSTSF